MKKKVVKSLKLRKSNVAHLKMKSLKGGLDNCEEGYTFNVCQTDGGFPCESFGISCFCSINNNC